MSLCIPSREVGVRFTEPNSDDGFDILHGVAAPGGDASFQDDAPVGSWYMERTNAQPYRKHTAGTGTDKWERMPLLTDIGNFALRGCLRVATGEVLTAGARDLAATPFTDDDAPTMTAADFTVGDLVVGGAESGTATLFEVTAIASPSITLAAAAPAFVEGDMFVAKTYLPDSPDDQEATALIHYVGTDVEKLGDVNWNFADGINLAASFTPVNGTITSADTVNSAIEKLVANQDDLQTLTGAVQGSVHYGTVFTGTTIPDGSNIQEALQALETALEAAGNGASRVEQTISSADGLVELDCMLVDDILSSEWELYIQEVGTQNVRIMEVEGFHNGSPTADATSTKRMVDEKKLLGSGFNFQVKPFTFKNSGATQEWCLNVETTVAGSGVRVIAHRTDVTNA